MRCPFVGAITYTICKLRSKVYVPAVGLTSRPVLNGRARKAARLPHGGPAQAAAPVCVHVPKPLLDGRQGRGDGARAVLLLRQGELRRAERGRLKRLAGMRNGDNMGQLLHLKHWYNTLECVVVVSGNTHGETGRPALIKSRRRSQSSRRTRPAGTRARPERLSLSPALAGRVPQTLTCAPGACHPAGWSGLGLGSGLRWCNGNT